MGNWWSKPDRETPAMEAIEQRHRAEKLERQKASQEAQINEFKAKAQSTELETLQTKARLLDEKTKNEEMTKSIRRMHEHTRDVCPTQWPTPQQFEATKKQYNYSPKKFHVAISGKSGTGKSSLINSLRGLYPWDRQAAPTGDVECTMRVTGYPDPDPSKSIVWFDVPGAGTLSHPEAEYFNDKGLYIFDAILVVFDNRFGSTDIAILRQCGLYSIPSYIVRSKADIHVRNRYDEAVTAENITRKQKKLRRLSKDEKARLFEDEKRDFAKATRESVMDELTRAGLLIQPVFIVSSNGLLSRVREKTSKVANAVKEMDVDGVKSEVEDGNNNPGAEGDGAGEVGDEDEDEDEDVPYVVFDEDQLLANLIYTSFLTRVAKDSQWYGSIMNSLSKRFPAWDHTIKIWPVNKAPAHESGFEELHGST